MPFYVSQPPRLKQSQRNFINYNIVWCISSVFLLNYYYIINIPISINLYFIMRLWPIDLFTVSWIPILFYQKVLTLCLITELVLSFSSLYVWWKACWSLIFIVLLKFENVSQRTWQLWKDNFITSISNALITTFIQIFQWCYILDSSNCYS